MSDKNIDCLYSLEPPWRDDSNEYPQSIIFSKIRKIMFIPVNPVYYIKMGFKGVRYYRYVFVMAKT